MGGFAAAAPMIMQMAQSAMSKGGDKKDDVRTAPPIPQSDPAVYAKMFDEKVTPTPISLGSIGPGGLSQTDKLESIRKRFNLG